MLEINNLEREKGYFGSHFGGSSPRLGRPTALSLWWPCQIKMARIMWQSNTAYIVTREQRERRGLSPTMLFPMP
jgi:hypothetical protein